MSDSSRFWNRLVPGFYFFEGRDTASPSITLYMSDAVSGQAWEVIPDEGIFMEDGRRVTIKVVFPGPWQMGTDQDTDGRALKARIRSRIMEVRWKDFRPSKAMDLDWKNIGVEVPLVTECYAFCPLMRGMPVVAFGTLTMRRDRYGDLAWDQAWFQTFEEAKDAQIAAQTLWDADRPRRRVIGMRPQIQELLRHWEDTLADELRVRAELLLEQPLNGTESLQELADSCQRTIQEIWKVIGYDPGI